MPIGRPNDFFRKKIILNDSKKVVNDIDTKFEWIAKQN